MLSSNHTWLADLKQHAGLEPESTTAAAPMLTAPGSMAEEMQTHHCTLVKGVVVLPVPAPGPHSGYVLGHHGLELSAT